MSEYQTQKHAVFIFFWSRLIPRHQLMIRSLKEQGWKISIIAWERNKKACHLASDTSLVDKWYWVSIEAKTKNATLLLKLPQLYFSIRQAVIGIEKIELLFLCHFFLLPLAMILPRREEKRIYDATEFFSLDLPSYFGSMARFVKPLVRYSESLFIKKVDGILTVDSKAGWLKEYYREMHAQVQVLWNLPSLADDPDEDETEKLIPFYQGRKVVTYVGGLTRQKGLDVGIRAAALARKRIPNVLFEFIGPWQQDRHEIETLVKSFNLEHHVRFVELMPYRDMLARLSFASVGLAIHQDNGSYKYVGTGNGRKFFSYMQAGVPIIAPSFGELGKIVENVGCGVRVNTSSPESVATSVCHYLMHPSTAKQAGQRGRTVFEKQFSWEKESGKFLSFLQQLFPKESL